MVAVSQLVKRYVDTRPVVHECLAEGIVNFAALADLIHDGVEQEMGGRVKRSAIIMALRRHAERSQARSRVKGSMKVSPEIIIKTDLCDVCVAKTLTALDRLRELHSLVDYSRGDTFNVIQGNSEISIIISQKFLPELRKRFGKERMLNVEKDLVSATMQFSKDFLYTPGIMAAATRKFAWENINIYEIVSTMTEMMVIVAESDAMRTYGAMRELVGGLMGASEGP